MSMWRLPQGHYKNMIMGCPPDLHAAVLELAQRHVPHRSGMLDCGCRSGALLSRFRDNGFDDLNGADLDREIMVPTDIPVSIIDLNTDFSERFDRTFNLITCSEVMEHLDSPRHFMTEARKILADDGYLLLTVPNIAFWVGRVKFALTGEHWGFGAHYWKTARHISPMTHDELCCTLREVGFDIVEITTGGSFFGQLKKALTWPAATAFRLFGGPSTTGECTLVLARKSEVDENLRRPELYFSAWEKTRIKAESGPA